MSVEQTFLAAWRMVINNRSIEGGLVFHSDRVVQYESKKFSNVTDSYYMVIRSMSRKANYWDNTVAEHFFKTLKTEQIYGNNMISKEQMELDIYEFIEIWDKHKIGHSALDYKTIEKFWRQKNNFKNVA
jgi:putative transposase